MLEHREVDDQGRQVFSRQLAATRADPPRSFRHGLNETEVSLVVTSHELLPKFRTMLAHCPALRTIVVMEDQIFPSDLSGYPDHVQVIPFKSVVKLGENYSLTAGPPTAESPAIIMYTSGSTGKPKGVVPTHGGWLSGITHTMRTVFNANQDDCLYVIGDPGWITGQSYLIAAPLAFGMSTVLSLIHI